MKVQTCSFLFLLVSTLQSVLINGQVSTLTCKKCERATSLDSCTGSVKCAVDEICYMEELITDELSVVYNSGCRSKIVCTSGVSGSPSIGKRDLHKRADLVACSRCCDIKKKSGELDCNARLCGIKYTNTNSTRCYLCDKSVSNAEQGDVDIPEDCLSETTCQPNEACGAQRFDFSGIDSHRYTCLPKRLCSLLTQEALKRKDECITNPDPRICGNVGNGKRASTNLCTACCGDGLCNSGSCEQVIGRLYNLWKGGALDFDTLKQKSTPLPVSTIQPSTQALTTPSTQAPTTPSTRAPTTPSTQAPTTPSTRAPTTPSTQAPTTPSTRAPTTPSTQAPTTPSTQAPTTPSTRAPTTPSTQASTTPSTQAPTTPSTQAPTTPSTQAPTTPSTQAPTQPTTQPPSSPATPSTQSPTKPPTKPPPTKPPTPITTATTLAPPSKSLATQPPPTLPSSTAQQTPAVATVVVSKAGASVAPSSPPALTPSTVIAPNTTVIVG